jgi:hypothetical protein
VDDVVEHRGIVAYRARMEILPYGGLDWLERESYG